MPRLGYQSGAKRDCALHASLVVTVGAAWAAQRLRMIAKGARAAQSKTEGTKETSGKRERAKQGPSRRPGPG